MSTPKDVVSLPGCTGLFPIDVKEVWRNTDSNRQIILLEGSFFIRSFQDNWTPLHPLETKEITISNLATSRWKLIYKKESTPEPIPVYKPRFQVIIEDEI